MLYDIRLAISYSYSAPAGAHRTVLRMLPRDRDGQRVLRGALRVEPAEDFRRDSLDFFGNPRTELSHARPLSAVSFTFEGRLLRDAPELPLDLSCGLSELRAEIAAVHSIAPDSPHHFTGPSPRVAPDPAITAFAREATSGARSVRAIVAALSRAIHDGFAFDPAATDVATDPAQAFAQRRGVCQDFSHVMIAGLRGLGIPAGYVSGFLRTIPPEGQPPLDGVDAMHAWVRAWCGAETGWLEIDPTNDRWAGADHVTVAVGRDYGDVSPVKGALRSAGGHGTSHSVDVVPVRP
ncbi:transglutaminase family protein [Pseudoponticoccus marisrubri]|uniref:Transglutaminase n=1 Tax=Pseudoponticoccus marisrubri TaxID=1685382 RepID=A0A0W7WQP2_9RHOB|nr:transglutaminase family protein [Pseudoponticoccus marisrubri]KUF12839.1 transglutaminase [Pseudoponticoccus marisrubri]